MPPDIHSALKSITEAAAHLRKLMSNLAAAVDRDDPEGIARRRLREAPGEPHHREDASALACSEPLFRSGARLDTIRA